ncbi:MAG: cupredoxin domain-containing protein [Chloroflexi bacterium]|nr:cupredoxin domain-containing protein [Chloroflexota bacterium]
MARLRIKGIMGVVGVAGLLFLPACASGSGASQTKPEASAAAGPAQEVKVDMGDFFYAPNDMKLKAGKVRFTLTNVGATAHRFAVKGGGVDISAKNVGAGRGSVFEAELAPGVYKMSCTLGDHEKRGSVGTITVQ